MLQNSDWLVNLENAFVELAATSSGKEKAQQLLQQFDANSVSDLSPVYYDTVWWLVEDMLKD